MKKSILGLIILVVLAVSGWYASTLFQTNGEDSSLASARIKALPDFSLPDLDGTPRNLQEWKGKVLVVNFWATWCPPCKKEMPTFIEMQKQHSETDLQFIGIAVDDPDMVRDFYDVYSINFPVLVGGTKAIELSSDLGNRFDGLPFTAVFDRTGKLRYIQTGQVTSIHIDRHILPLL